jgi:IS30 family transposase
MTIHEKQGILELRNKGLTYRQIGQRLGLSINTVKSFCRREEAKKKICRNCGASLEQTLRRKPKTFCGARCRTQWWKNHRDRINKKAFYSVVCANCGERFISYQEFELAH